MKFEHFPSSNTQSPFARRQGQRALSLSTRYPRCGTLLLWGCVVVLLTSCSFGSARPGSGQASDSQIDTRSESKEKDSDNSLSSEDFSYFISPPFQRMALDQSFVAEQLSESVLASDERSQLAQSDASAAALLLAQSQKSAERKRVAPPKNLEKRKPKAIRKLKRKSEKTKGKTGDDGKSGEEKEIEVEDDSELFTFFVKAEKPEKDRKNLLVQSPLSADAKNTRAMLALPKADKLASYSQSLFWNLKRHSFIAELTMLAVVFFGFMVILWVRLQYEVARPFSAKVRLDKSQ